tara:strand:- start:1305 stop:1652 length:348 start_codon:yes stop_codon:yes gene_type:complete
MKKLIITLLLLLNITLISAQATMQGMWTCEGSSYITTILKIEDKVTEVLNYSFEAGKSVPENIVNQTNKKLKTRLYNKDNNYLVHISYTLKNDSIMTGVFTGDLNKTYIFKKLKL